MDNKKSAGRTYYGQVYDNFLMHWKYIKREKVGDKWRYFYNDDDLNNAKRTRDIMKDRNDDANRQLDTSREVNEKRLRTLNDEHNKKYGDQAGNDENWPKYFDKAKQYMEAINSAQNYANRTAKDLSDAEEEYKKEKGEYDKSVGVKVANGLNKIADKLDKDDNKLAKNSSSKTNSTSEQVIKEKVIPEKVIKEQIIPEKVIKEKTIPEKTIKEKVVPEKVIREKTIKENVFDSTIDKIGSSAKKGKEWIKRLFK